MSLTIQAKEEEEKKNRESRSPVTFSGAGPVECLYFSLLHLPIFIFLSLYFWMVVFSSFFFFFFLGCHCRELLISFLLVDVLHRGGRWLTFLVCSLRIAPGQVARLPISLNRS